MQKLRIVILGFGTARQKVVLERWTKPKPLGANLDSGTIYNRAEGFWIGPYFKSLSLSKKVPKP
jgi:hypothetical protein